MALTCQTDSRIADASRSWQQACNVDVTGWDIANEFIVATYALADSVNPDSDFKMQWRRAGGSFADVGADTEICWGTNTVLVDGGAVGSAAGCLSPIDDDVENEGDNLAHLDNIANGDYCEIQWALGFGSGAIGSQEYELQLVSIDWSNSAVLQVSITTAAAGDLSINVSESITTGETIGPSAPLAGVSKSESLTVSELRDLLISILPESADSMTISELTELLMNINPYIFESITISEAVQAAMTLAGISTDDTINISELVGVERYDPPVEINAAESINITEVIQAAMKLAGVGQVESVAITETVIGALPVRLTVFDMISIVESATLRLGIEIGKAEAITVSELYDAAVNIAPSVFESMTATEFVQVLLKLAVISEQDTLAVAELVSMLLNLPNIDKAEAVNISEYVDAILEALTLINESELINLVENIQARMSLAGVAKSDRVSIAELVAADLAGDRWISVSQAVVIIEHIQASMTLAGISATESMAVAETVIGALPVKPGVQNIIHLMEYVAMELPLLMTASDVMAITENVLWVLDPMLAAAYDAVEINESVTALMEQLVGAVSASEAIRINEHICLSLVKGEISIVFTNRQPGITYAAKKPGITYAAKKPDIIFQ